MRRFFADTFAMIVFSFVVGAFVEIVIAGLSVEQTIGIRVAAAPISLLIGRPYGIYRDWLFKRLGGAKKTSIRRILIDTFANLTFQVPLYGAILAANGANLTQVLTAVSSILLIASITGRPFGILLGICRKALGATND